MSTKQQELADIFGIDVAQIDSLPAVIHKQAFLTRVAEHGIRLSDAQAEEAYSSAATLQQKLAGFREANAKQAALRDPVNMAISLISGANSKTASAPGNDQQGASRILNAMLSDPATFAAALTYSQQE